MIRARFVFPLALGALGSACALADQLILLPTKDNTLFSSDAESGLATSDGAGPRLYVGQTSFAGARRALIAFDINSLPASAEIDSVSLSFNVTSFHGSQTITLHRLLSDWGEGASNSGIPGGTGAPAEEGDATWMFHHYSVLNPQPWLTPGGDFAADESASGTAAAVTFVLSSSQMAADVLQWRDNPSTSFGWILIGNEALFGSADRLDSKENTTANFRPTLTIDYSVSNPTPEWNLDADGSWAVPANWGGAVPDSPTAIANLLGKITAPRTITLDGNRTLAAIHFDNSNRYTIAPGAGGVLTTGAIIVSSGTHEISAKVFTSPGSVASVSDNTTLILSGGLQISTDLLVSGGGNVILAGPQTHQNGSSLTISSGRVQTTSNAGAPADAGAAASAPLSIAITGDTGPASLILASSQDLNSLTIDHANSGPQLLDLASTPTTFNALSIHGGDLTAAKSSLTLAIQQGKTTGEGIIDSGLHPGAAIGIAALSDAHGDPYLLIRPTRIGDLNLDGAVTISDFIDLASHFNGVGGWQEGDLNYDGSITISDFIDLASNFNTAYTGASFPISPADQMMLASFAQAHGITLVPEPGSLMMLITSAYSSSVVASNFISQHHFFSITQKSTDCLGGAPLDPTISVGFAPSFPLVGYLPSR